MRKRVATIVTATILLLIFTSYYRSFTVHVTKPAPHISSESAVTKPGSPSPPVSASPASWAGEAEGKRSPAGPIIYRDKVVALIYHHFAPQESDITISRERFASHLDMLATKGYHVISLEELAGFLAGKPIPPNAVLLTIDDGYTSIYEVALPELKRRKMPAVVFVIGAYMGKTLGVLPHFGWEQAQEMEANNISIQSHTYDQHKLGQGKDGKFRPLLEGPLAAETEQDFENRVFQDLSLSKKDLDYHLGRTSYALAWPFGRASEEARKIAAKVGFKLIFTADYGVITRQSDPLKLPRINAGSPKISASQLDLLLRQATGTSVPKTAEASLSHSTAKKKAN